MTTRRAILKSGTVLALGSAVPRGADAYIPATFRSGPYLALDRGAFRAGEGVTVRVRPPERLPQPVLSSARFGVTQPYVGLVRDPETQRLRLWYNRGNQVWHTESRDGVEWDEPRLAWDLKRCYGVTVIDDQGRDPDPQRRFKLANWQATPERENSPQEDSGMSVGFSPDGFRSTPSPRNPVLPTWPEGYGKPLHHGVGDIIDAFWDPIHRRYGCAVKVHAIPGDGYEMGPRAGKQFMRRWIGMSTSEDFERWKQPWTIVKAEAEDPGLTEFYGMGGVHARGNLLVGFARVLRDDLPCDPGGPANGIGWSCLMTSVDGVTWTRHREPFLDRAPQAGAWDHAMAWLSGAIPDGDKLLLYYGGYARGHKVEPTRERQIGLARMKRDRYASLSAGPGGGTATFGPGILEARRLTLNADARGEIRARLVDHARKALRGYDYPDCAAIRGDSLAHALQWKGGSAPPQGREAWLELRLRDADLFAVELV